MKKHYLRLSVYSCDKCSGPVVAGSTAFRENEIEKETHLQIVGAICLSCGHRQTKATDPDRTRSLPPMSWEPVKAVDAILGRTA
jgi:RNase P subunit RPR2